MILHTLKLIGFPATCHSSAFTCDSGKCVHSDYRCNGYADCPDDGDEIACGMFNMMCCITHNKIYWFSSNLSFLCVYV